MTEIEVPPSIVDLVSIELRRLIATGEMVPGPIRISELVKRFKVSPPPIREALRRLEAEGLVSFSQYRGVLLKSLSVDSLREIFEMRMMLEPLLLKHAVPALADDAKACEDLQEHLAIMDETVGQPERWRDANTAFHLGMYEYANTPYLRNVVISSWTVVEPYLRLYVTEEDALHVAQREHRELLELAIAGKGEEASLLLYRHLEETLEVVERRLSTGPVPIESDSTQRLATQ